MWRKAPLIADAIRLVRSSSETPATVMLTWRAPSKFRMGDMASSDPLATGIERLTTVVCEPTFTHGTHVDAAATSDPGHEQRRQGDGHKHATDNKPLMHTPSCRKRGAETISSRLDHNVYVTRVVLADGPHLDSVLAATYPIWHDGLDPAAYGRFY